MDERKQISAIRSGNREVFGQVFECHYANLCDFACSIVGSPEIAKDAVQQVFVSIWHDRHQWNPSGTLRSYLYKAVKNASISVLRRQGVRDRYQMEVADLMNSTDVSPLQRLEEMDFASVVREAIDQLPERRRAIFLLYFFHGLTYQEIGDALDISTSTIHVQIKRATDFLKNRLEAVDRV